jgi:hypothetical protein
LGFAGDVLLKIAMGRDSKTDTANANATDMCPSAKKSSSTAGGNLIEVLINQARQDEALIAKIKTAVDAKNKNLVFKLAAKLVGINGA